MGVGKKGEGERVVVEYGGARVYAWLVRARVGEMGGLGEYSLGEGGTRRKRGAGGMIFLTYVDQ